MTTRLDDDTLSSQRMRHLQRHSFDYFIHESNAANGLVRDKTADQWPASIAAVGMALTVYLVGVERGFMTRADAVARTLTTLRFFAASEQSDAPGATGYRGFYYHFLDMETGRRAWQCELSSIDTSLLMAGVLSSAAYFSADDDDEAEIRRLGRLLYERVDWQWMLAGEETLCHGWRPEQGFLPYHWHGYDESLVMQLLALGSPTHPVGAACYEAWCATFQWQRLYDLDVLYAGPLFIHQLSHIWCDLRDLRDAFMRTRDCDYFENSRRATQVQQRYAIDNPHGFVHVGSNCWGITASDGPGMPATEGGVGPGLFLDYVARGAPFGPDDGTIAPWVVAASLPFAPEIVVPTILHFADLDIETTNQYGFKASFNRQIGPDAHRSLGWVSPYHFGINEGPTVLMIENYRSELIWSLMRNCAPLVNGLRIAGFAGGWLVDATPRAASLDSASLAPGR